MFLMYARNILCLSLNVWLEGSFFLCSVHIWLEPYLHLCDFYIVNPYLMSVIFQDFNPRPVCSVSLTQSHRSCFKGMFTWGLRICSYLLWFFRMLLTYWSIWYLHPWKICVSVVIWKLKFILCFIRFEGKIQCLSEPLCLMEYLCLRCASNHFWCRCYPSYSRRRFLGFHCSC